MSAKYVSIDEFVSIVGYLIAQRSSSPQSRFCLFRVSFENPQFIGSSFGAQDAMRRLNQFGTLLASTVRTSDVVSRDVSVFWVLSPNSDFDVVRERVTAIVKKVDEFGLDIVSCNVRAQVFPHPEAAEITDARQLLDRFEGLSDVHGLGTSLNQPRAS
jgi:hypothetical protein